jgi:hypothetical protein
MLKALFGLVGLLIALAIVSSLAKSQFGAIRQVGEMTTRLFGSSGSEGAASSGRASGEVRLGGVAAPPGAGASAAPQQGQGGQKSVFGGARDALDQGEERYKRAESSIGR